VRLVRYDFPKTFMKMTPPQLIGQSHGQMHVPGRGYVAGRVSNGILSVDSRNSITILSVNHGQLLPRLATKGWCLDARGCLGARERMGEELQNPRHSEAFLLSTHRRNLLIFEWLPDVDERWFSEPMDN
jgi:hypothetical protein